MTLFDEVARLRDLSGKAEQPPWWWNAEQIVLFDTHTGDAIGIPNSEYDMELAARLRNAAPWLLEAAACFQQGDARCLKAIMGIMRAATGPDTDSDELDCLRRLQKAAEIMEELE